ncbi:uncharacterized protein [Nicotiana tomentosiformis]|uniref:uncharacterized protein n=1 Tax=Nicotiana tomentosiformis TaxID=4098 RepID=UPI00388C7040
MVKEYPNNDMTEAVIQQTFYRGINTTNQCMVNQLAGDNFMNTPYLEVCEILDEMADTSSAWQSQSNVPQSDPNVIHLHKELHDHGQAITELTTTMNQLAKAQLQQVPGKRQVNAMEGVNVMANKMRQRGQQVQHNQDQFEQSGSGYNQDNSYDDQSEEVQYVNNNQSQRSNVPNQQRWRSQGTNQNWGNQGQRNWNNGNNNNPNNWGNNNQNWGNQRNNQGNWGGNNNSNWGGNRNQGGWNYHNQGNRGSGPQSPPMYQQPASISVTRAKFFQQ